MLPYDFIKCCAPGSSHTWSSCQRIERTKITFCGWHMLQTRGSLVRFFQYGGPQSNLACAPRCWEQPFTSIPSPQPVFMFGICSDSNTHRWWASDSPWADKMRKIFLVWLLCKPQLCFWYCPDWPLPHTPKGPSPKPGNFCYQRGPKVMLAEVPGCPS